MVFSGRPGTIKGEFKVAFEYPRKAEIRYTTEFAELAGEVGKVLEKYS